MIPDNSIDAKAPCARSRGDRSRGGSAPVYKIAAALPPVQRVKPVLWSLFLFASGLLTAQSVDPSYLSAMQYRCIGPHRGGRTVGAVGVPQQPNVFYIGVNNGGVWRTDDFGRTWTPIFDDQPTGSIGDVAVAPSDPNVIYVASGEGIQRPDLSVGDGVYKSTNGGRTWTNMGLRDGLQIGGLAIDPGNPDRVFVAIQGHPYGPNTERGVYRSTNGGKNWEQVLYRDENTGAAQVSIDPQNPNIVYADLWENRLAPWENGEWHGEGSGLWKSTDGGNTWQPLTKGLPTPADGLGRIGFCVSPSNANRLYATVNCDEYGPNGQKYGGIYRSDDAGESWTRTAGDNRLWGRGDDFAEITCDPKNPDVVYTANVATWKSTDGGYNFSDFRGAPGGDDYHRIWINPDNPEIILIASDQGAIITVNGGKTFSSWYNQPTAQFYHVSTDNDFPYNVYSGQQESGSVCISSRGNDGQITFREWHPVGAEEYGYVAADPLDPNIIYGGKLSRYDKRTGQTQYIRPDPLNQGNYRYIRTQPVLFSPIDPHVLYFAGNVLFKTRNGGQSWTAISPDLTRERYENLPDCIGKYKSSEEVKKLARRGVIYTIAPSPLDSNLIWAGTDDGLIHLTRDGGKTWTNVTPPEVTDWSKVSLMDASHTVPKTAYAAINRIRCDDLRPHILRTRDGGLSWKEITTGIPDNEPINAVREDPQQPGLLFAGSERAVYVSFDDGEHWQSLRLNMPATSIRDLVIKDDDLVLGTHGRSFWILDDITPLRQLADAEIRKQSVVLFKPQTAVRVRWNLNTDTPLPPEEPAGQNPPDGALIDYFLKENVRSVKLEILEPGGTVIRTYTDNDRAPDVSHVNYPLYWLRTPQLLSGTAGAHRFCWDMRYDPLHPDRAYFSIAAIYRNTAQASDGLWVQPGLYTVRLTVDGKAYEQPIQVVMDPRVKTSAGDLDRQFTLAKTCYDSRKAIAENVERINILRAQAADLLPKTKGPLKTEIEAWDAALADVQKEARRIDGRFSGLFQLLEGTEMPPTQDAASAVAATSEQFGVWEQKRAAAMDQLAGLNLKLHKAKLPEIQMQNTFKPSVISPAENLFASPDLSDAIFPKGIWSIQNGELTATEDQCIWTKKTYKNFQLDLDFKTADGTNSGVIVHCSNTDDWIPNSVEIQIADDYSKEWSKAPGTWQCGAIFGHLAATEHTVKKPGEWNHYTITCKNREIWVVLNGKQVNYMDMNRWVSGSTNPDGSSIPSWLYKPFARLPLEGHIGLQGKHAGAPIWFKNVRIQEIAD